MKIERIDIEGFGAFGRLQITLNPQVNIFVGENESGKSTLQQAILALLYGFYQGSRITPSERRLHERFRPWQGDAYGGCLDYALDSGQRFRIQRSFATDDVPTSLIDLTTGRDITRDLGVGRHGNVPIARTHLGMGRDVFLSTCFVDQAAILTIDAPQAVAETVVSIADTARADASAAQAIGRLEEALSKQVGGPRARTAPLPIAQGRLERAKGELRDLEAAQKATEDEAIRKESLEDQCRQLRDRLRRISFLRISKRVEEIDRTLAAVKEIERNVTQLENEADMLREYSAFPSEVRDTVLTQRSRLETLTERRDALQRRWKGASPQLEALEEEVRQCHDQIEKLEFTRGFPIEKEDMFNRIRFSLEDSLHKLSSLRQEMRDLQADVSKTRGTRRLPRVALAGGLGLALVLGIGSIIASIGSIGLPMAAVVMLATLASYFLLRAAPSGKQRLDELVRIIEGEASHAAELQQQLMTLVHAVGIEADSVDTGIQLFQRRAADSNTLSERQAILNTLEERLRGLRSLRQQFEDSEDQVEEATKALLEVLRRAGLDATEVELGIPQFEERYSKRLRFDAVQQDIRRQADQRRSLLGDQTEAMLVGQKDRLDAQRAAILAVAPELLGTTTDSSIHELESEEGRHGEQLKGAEQEIVRLDERIGTSLSGHRPRCDVEEDIARYENEVDRLERFGAALTLARDVLQQATEEVHRDFAPRLAQSLGQTLSQITQGRYGAAFVDPKDLTIRLQVPETGGIVESGQLSMGTQEQAYLLLRIELARMLSARRETLPLLLDDPFVNFDDRRLQRILELLMEISEANQVLLFTKDSFVPSWFYSNQEEGTVFNVHQLPAPLLGQGNSFPHA